MRKLLLYGYVTHTKVQKKSEFHNSDFPLHENNARSLTKNVLQRERQYGRLLCEWKCKGNEENGEYGGWCLIINYKQDKWKIIPISGDDLSKGGITHEGEFWFADYDYLVQARIFTLVKKGSEEYKYIQSQIKNGKENLLRED